MKKTGTNKKQDELVDLLLDEGPTADTTSSNLKESDPVISTDLDLTIDDINQYDRNPRLFDNDKYRELKQAIRHENDCHGKISVTRRPGDDKYIVDAGGNTRLKILKELYQETKDLSFYHLRVRFKPWSSEFDVLLRHMKENDLRADYLFIERALGVRQIRDEVETQTGELLSTRKLSALLGENGYPVNQTNIVRYNYAVDVLYPVIPNAFQLGLGRPKADALKKLDTSYRGYWIAHQFDEAEFEVLWRSVLSQNDTEDISINLVEEDLATGFLDPLKVKLANYPAPITVKEVMYEVSVYKTTPEAAVILTGSAEDNWGWVDINKTDVDKQIHTTETTANHSPEERLLDLQKADNSELTNEIDKPTQSNPEVNLTNEEVISVKPGQGREQELQTLREEIRRLVCDYVDRLGRNFRFPLGIYREVDAGYGFYMQVPEQGGGVWEMEPTRCIWWKLFLLSRSDAVNGIDGVLLDFKTRLVQKAQEMAPDKEEDEWAPDYYQVLGHRIDCRFMGDNPDIPIEFCSSFHTLMMLECNFGLMELTTELQRRICRIHELFQDHEIGIKAVGLDRIGIEAITDRVGV